MINFQEINQSSESLRIYKNAESSGLQIKNPTFLKLDLKALHKKYIDGAYKFAYSSD